METLQNDFIDLNEEIENKEIEKKETTQKKESIIEQKIKICIKELNINEENITAIEKLKEYIITPEKIIELLDEEDIFNLFIDKFTKRYL